jgi:multidrug resistance protein, MATE family
VTEKLGLKAALGEVWHLVTLAVPLVIGLAASTLLGVTDTIMLAPLGTVPLAAVSLTASVVVIFYAGVYGLLSVIGMEVAQAYGASDPRRASAAVRRGLVLGAMTGAGGAVIMASILLLLPYLGQPQEVLDVIAPYWLTISALLFPFAILIVLKQLFDSIDRPWLGVGIAFAAVVLNVPLNWALIYGVGPFPELGLFGAGLASFISESFSALAAFFVWRGASFLKRYRVRAKKHGQSVGQLLGGGAPLGLMYAAESGSYAIAGIMIGLFGTAALAAKQVTSSIADVLYMLPLGMAGAVAIRVAQAAGAEQNERLRSIVLAALGVVTLWMLMVTGGLIVGGEWIAASLSTDPRVISLATTLFIAIALMQVMDGIQSTSMGALRGLMDFKVATIVSLIAYWPIALSAAWVLAFPMKLGPVGIWIGFAIGLSFAAIALPIRFFYLTRPGNQSRGASSNPSN